MVWSQLASIGIRSTMTVYKNRHLIQHWWTRLLVFVRKGNTDVVIVGRPNVGKSLLSSHLYGEASNISFELPETSVAVESKAIQIGEWTQLVRVIPGQSNVERAQGLHEAFHSHDDLQGVIYVADWGYTDVRNHLIKRKLIENEKIETIEKLRDFNLKNELEDLKYVLQSIKEAYGNKRGPKWLIIAVNKVDLFYKDITEAEKYYSIDYESPFTNLVNAMLNEVGRQNIKCISLPISSWQKNLEWNGEEIRTDLGGREIGDTLSQNFVLKMVELSK